MNKSDENPKSNSKKLNELTKFSDLVSLDNERKKHKKKIYKSRLKKFFKLVNEKPSNISERNEFKKKIKNQFSKTFDKVLVNPIEKFKQNLIKKNDENDDNEINIDKNVNENNDKNFNKNEPEEKDNNLRTLAAPIDGQSVKNEKPLIDSSIESSTNNVVQPSEASFETSNKSNLTINELRSMSSGSRSNSPKNLTSNKKIKKSIFFTDKLEQIQNHFKDLRINKFLDEIVFIEYDKDIGIKNYTTNELVLFEKDLKKKRIEIDLYLFTFKHFYELIKEDIINSIESIEIISKWITIKDEKIEFWSKLNQSVYVQIEIKPGKYDLIIKDENNDLIRFNKDHFHQTIKTFATRITNYELMIKSLSNYLDKINAKKQLTTLNLVNLYNFKAKKAAHKYVKNN